VNDFRLHVLDKHVHFRWFPMEDREALKWDGLDTVNWMDDLVEAGLAKPVWTGTFGWKLVLTEAGKELL